MNEPKISVITPMYNCERYILDCARSVINQNFKAYEHIIVDDCSTDRSVEVVEKIISVLKNSGEENIPKLIKHEKNTGQEQAVNDGIAVARGKYIRVLHADDVFMPNALDSLYKIAEQYDAEVVHETARLISTEDGGATIYPGCRLEWNVHDRHAVDEITKMSLDLNDRVADWFERGTYVDSVYNLFRRDFLTNEVRYEGSNFIFTLYWLMKAKCAVKVPQATYIYRLNPQSITNKKRSVEKIAGTIDAMIKSVKIVDEFMSTIDFFSDKKYLRELIKIQTASTVDGHSIHRHGYYREELTAELYEAVGRAMEKHFGDAGWLAAYYFHIAHEAHFGRFLENERLFRDQTSAKYVLYPTL